MLLLAIAMTVLLVVLAVGLGLARREDHRRGELLDEQEEERENPWNAV